MLKYSLLFTPFLLWATPFQGQHQIDVDSPSHEMIVSFKASSQPTLINGKVQFEEKKIGFIAEPSAPFLQDQQFKSLFPLSYSQNIQRAQSYFEAPPSSKIDIIKLSGMMEVDITNTPLNELIPLCQQFETLPQVEYCSLNPIAPPPQITTPPASPDYSDKQGYLKDAPDGINALYAWNLGIYGQGVKLSDAEWAWDHSHEDLANVSVGKAQISDNYAEHGTAVVGILMAQHNGFGIKGATPQAHMTTYSENLGRTSAISAMITDASAGDILILEMQTPGCEVGAGQGDYGPADYSSSVWNLIKSATDAGIIIVSAAGNGNQNLDHSCYQNYRDRGDNGGIIVGAGFSSDLRKAGFSTYGSKVHLKGSGHRVTTTGYGDLQNTTHKDYTQFFSGTSSATPIVASAIALVQSWTKQNLNRFLTPSEMRTLLINTGKALLGGKHIGPLPDVKAAIESLIQQNNLSSAANLSSQAVSSLQLSSSSSIPLISSSSSPLSSHLISSSVIRNSSDAEVSSSSTETAVINNCDGIALWKSSSPYSGIDDNGDGVVDGPEVIFNGKKYSHKAWWSNGNNPEVFSNIWSFVENCSDQTTTSSSSEEPSSSSIVLLSSSTPLSSSFTEIRSSSSIAPLSSSLPLSSSFTEASSSSIILSSSSTNADCDGLPQWESRTYDWVPQKELVQYNQRKYSHQNWVDASTPDQSWGWTDEGPCSSSATFSARPILVTKAFASFELSQDDQYQISIYDIQGSKIQSFPITGYFGINEFHFQSPLEKGVYYLKLINNSQQSTLKITIQ